MNTSQEVGKTGQVQGLEGNLSPAKTGFDTVSQFVNSFNTAADSAQALNETEIIAKLKTAGAVNDDILKTLSAKDIAGITGLSDVLSNALCKKLTSGGSDRPDRILTRLSVQSYSTEALLKKYNPNELDSAVTGELILRAKRATGRNPRVIVFHDDLSVNVEQSWSNLQDAFKGDPDLRSVNVGGTISYTYKIGEIPADVVDLHPVTGRALRSNGVGSDGFNWSETSYESRQLLKLAVDTGELGNNLSRRDKAYYFNLAKSADGMAQLQLEFPHAARRFMEHKALGSLPVLKQFRHREGHGNESHVEDSDDMGDLLSSGRRYQ